MLWAVGRVSFCGILVKLDLDFIPIIKGDEIFQHALKLLQIPKPYHKWSGRLSPWLWFEEGLVQAPTSVFWKLYLQ